MVPLMVFVWATELGDNAKALIPKTRIARNLFMLLDIWLIEIGLMEIALFSHLDYTNLEGTPPNKGNVRSNEGPFRTYLEKPFTRSPYLLCRCWSATVEFAGQLAELCLEG